jgi:hypothetical protein
MATREHSSKPQRLTSRTAKSKSGRAKRKLATETDCVYGLPVPDGLHEVIETERDNLARAESVLGCLAVSMEYYSEAATKPYYPDVARLASEMIRQSINGLDALNIQKCLLRNRIKEESARWYDFVESNLFVESNTRSVCCAM